MNKVLYSFILVLIFSGCATYANFVNERNYDVGRSVDLSYARPLKVISHNQNQDKYLFEWKDGCKWAYYVNKETKIVESWEFISFPDKCSSGGYYWFGPFG